jgi:hypothetical protein
MISVIKMCLGVALFGLQDVNVSRLCYFVKDHVGNCNNFALILFEFILGSISRI